MWDGISDSASLRGPPSTRDSLLREPHCRRSRRPRAAPTQPTYPERVQRRAVRRRTRRHRDPPGQGHGGSSLGDQIGIGCLAVLDEALHQPERPPSGETDPASRGAQPDPGVAHRQAGERPVEIDVSRTDDNQQSDAASLDFTSAYALSMTAPAVVGFASPRIAADLTSQAPSERPRASPVAPGC